MLCASASNSASANFAAIRDVLTQGRDIFVINVGDLVTTETTWLLFKLLVERRSLCRLILRLF